MGTTHRHYQQQALAEDFTASASRYDLLCRLNPGYHKHLLESAGRLQLARNPRVLDLCCGTGLSTDAILKAHPDAEVTAVDASEGMLAVARTKPRLHDVRFVLGDASDPISLGIRGPFDAIFMAYGIRNVADKDECLVRLHALLTADGLLGVHEYTLDGRRRSELVWKAVTTAVVMPLGRALTGSTTLFRYLKQSVMDFDRVDDLARRLCRAGFGVPTVHEVDGWQRGIVHMLVARKSS